MRSRYFWKKAGLMKYVIVFETEETVLGRNDKNEFCLFRKDTDEISFSEREVLKQRLSKLKAEKKETKNAKKLPFSRLNRLSLRDCFS